MTRQTFTDIFGSKVKGHKGPHIIQNILMWLFQTMIQIRTVIDHAFGGGIYFDHGRVVEYSSDFKILSAKNWQVGMTRNLYKEIVYVSKFSGGA